MFRLTKPRFVILLFFFVTFVVYTNWINLFNFKYGKDIDDAADERPAPPDLNVPEAPKEESKSSASSNIPDLTADTAKQDQIVKAFKDSWAAYERDAMGCDEYHPISKHGSNLTRDGGIGFMVVDAIDTMQIMGLEDEYQRARSWIEHGLSFDRDGTFNTFETTIRVLGGLLSAYHLARNDTVFLEKAVDLADRLLITFETPSGLPTSDVNLKLRKALKDVAPVSTAEASTLQLEFRYLSYITHEDKYWKKAEKAMKVIKTARTSDVLVPIYMDATTGRFQSSEIRLGSRGDSYYEYLLKQYLQTGKSEKVYREMYEETVEAIHSKLVRKGLVKGMQYTIELLPEYRPQGKNTYRESHKQDHLVCFLGGSLLLGATTTGANGDVSVPPTIAELTETGQKDWQLGLDLIDTCVDTYEGTATGLSPEIAYFWESDAADKEHDWYIKGNDHRGSPSYDARYILRPETVESLFIAYRLTGDAKYRESGWKIFRAIEKHCSVETGGYASILDVDDVKSAKLDKMETFFLAETLKYLYLLFADAKELPLNEYVFNTEAHPLPIFVPAIQTGFS